MWIEISSSADPDKEEPVATMVKPSVNVAPTEWAAAEARVAQLIPQLILEEEAEFLEELAKYDGE